MILPPICRALLFLLLFFPLTAAAGPSVRFPAHDGVTVAVEEARTEDGHRRGLMFRERLDPAAGMLFFFDRTAPLAFWMKNVRFPLDLIFLDDQWRIVTLHRSVPPCVAEPCAVYRSGLPVRYVLEVTGGFSKNHGLREGERVEYRP